MRKNILGILFLAGILCLTACGEADEVQEEETVQVDINAAEGDEGKGEAAAVAETEMENTQSGEPGRFYSDFSGVKEKGAERGIIFSCEEKKISLDDEGFVYFKARYNSPSVEIKSNTPAAAAINSYLLDSTVNYETNMELLKAESESMLVPGPGNEPVEYSVTLDVVPTRLDERVIAMKGIASEYSGGAHGINSYTGYNFDAATGNLLTIASIAKDTNLFKASAVDYIKEACANMGEDAMFFDSYESCIGAMVDEGSWYMTDEGVVFIAGEYLLAPYASGIIEVQVPYSSLESVNEIYLPQQ